jgi:hypothetical protein
MMDFNRQFVRILVFEIGLPAELQSLANLLFDSLEGQS